MSATSSTPSFSFPTHLPTEKLLASLTAAARSLETAARTATRDARAAANDGARGTPLEGKVEVVVGGLLAGSAAALLAKKLFIDTVPKLRVPLEPLEASDNPKGERTQVVPDMKLVNPARPGFVQCYNPSTAERIGEVPDMTKEDVEAALKRARAAQVSWAKTSYAKRRKFLEILLRYTTEEIDAITRVSIRDSGKVKLDAVLGEIVPTCEKLRWCIKFGEETLRPSARGGQSVMVLHKSARVEYRPVGVIAVFAPFNYPFTNMMNHIASGCFAGNAVVVKVSEFTSWSASLYLRVVRAALQQVGADPELVQVITGMAPAGAALASSPNIDKIIFTGSDRIGKIIMKQASEHLTPCVLELGGKDPFVVFGDVSSVSRCATIASRGTFQNAGQNCIGIERIFVQKSIEKEFIDHLVRIASSMRLGDPLSGKTFDLGPLCTPVQLAHVESLVQDAVSKGAILHFGGKRETSLAPGLFFQPTVLSNVQPNMRITQEEVFGPVAAIRAFTDEAHLLTMVNDCPFALGASVFTGSHAKGVRVAKGLCSGMCNVNDFGVNYLVQSLPFGGVKASGYGRFGGPEGLRECCNMVSLTEDAYPGIQTDLPGAFTYPVASNAHKSAAGLIKFAYSPYWSTGLGGLATLLRGVLFPTRE